MFERPPETTRSNTMFLYCVEWLKFDESVPARIKKKSLGFLRQLMHRHWYIVYLHSKLLPVKNGTSPKLFFLILAGIELMNLSHSIRIKHSVGTGCLTLRRPFKPLCFMRIHYKQVVELHYMELIDLQVYLIYKVLQSPDHK